VVLCNNVAGCEALLLGLGNGSARGVGDNNVMTDSRLAGAVGITTASSGEGVRACASVASGDVSSASRFSDGGVGIGSTSDCTAATAGGSGIGIGVSAGAGAGAGAGSGSWVLSGTTTDAAAAFGTSAAAVLLWASC
jgi:hypothetical protein